jgi:hypothetical protein
MAKRKVTSEKLMGNKNAEKWNIDTATELFNSAIELSENIDYDFIGEIAKDLNQDKGLFDHLVERFPELKPLKTRIKSNCEVNCYRNTKKNRINTAVGIINLKSNHGWTDRNEIDHTTKGEQIKQVFVIGGKEIEF